MEENGIDLKARFIEILTGTKRKNVDAVIIGLEKLGFFDAPASKKHHLAKKGGLCEHSLNVYQQAMAIRDTEIGIHPELEAVLKPDSIAIAALLHDVCKAEVYKIGFRNKKNEQTGQWEKVAVYENDYSHCPLGHGEKSVIRLLTAGLELTADEIYAIRWHMGAWEIPDSFEAKGNFSDACDKCPLLDIIMVADELATRVTEGWVEKQLEIARAKAEAAARAKAESEANAKAEDGNAKSAIQ